MRKKLEMHGKNTRVFIILSLRRTEDDLRVSLHKGFKIRLAGIVPISLEFTDVKTVMMSRHISSSCFGNEVENGRFVFT